MFTEMIRWSGGAFALLAGLFLLVLASIFGPIFFIPIRGRGLIAPVIIGVLIVVVFICVVWIFGTLRTSIDQRTLTVGFGPFRDNIPLERIVACGPTTYNWWSWGGFGIRFGRQAKLYNVPGDKGMAVQILLDDGRQLLFSSHDPIAICRALQQIHPTIREI